MTWLKYLPVLTLLVAFRYFIIAGAFFFIYYKWLRNRISYRKIQERFPKNADYWREIGYSLITIVIFALVTVLFLFTPLSKVTLLYKDIHQYGIAWFIIAFPLIFIVHDAWFYWTHRLMHHPPIFRIFHLLHHRSTNPSPWAAFAFHPTEAFVEAAIFPVLLIMMPLTTIHFLVFFIFMLIYNVYGHLGWEIYPKGFSRHWVGRWINTSVNHNQHHQFFKGNYGLYFLWWDRWMGTIREDYDKGFDAVKDRKTPVE
jgi:Delta7-sterol 5-desaturase